MENYGKLLSDKLDNMSGVENGYAFTHDIFQNAMKLIWELFE